jgi:hypothetical protein
MKSWILCMGIIGLTLAPVTGVASPLVVTFDDLTLSGSNSYYNGGPTTNTLGWTSQGVGFGNGFTDWGGGFTSWNGFAYSNVNDTTTGVFTNQYAAVTGTAYAGSIYAVAYSGLQDFINLPAGYAPQSVRVTNTTYAALDMANGSGFSRKFGAGDFLTVTFTGYTSAGATGTATGSTTFYLGDFLDGKSTIVTAWELLDLTPLGSPASIGLSWASSDVGSFGINTPTYAAIDSLTLTPVPEPSSLVLLACTGAVVGAGMWRRRVRAA